MRSISAWIILGWIVSLLPSPQAFAAGAPGDLAVEPVTTIKAEGATWIEAENWMNGGPGVAFEDDDYTSADTYQHPRAPRPKNNSNLVPQTRNVGNGNYLVTHIQDPDWMAYKINVEKEGVYRFSAKCGSNWKQGVISLYLDGSEKAITTISVSNLPRFDWSLGMAQGGVAELPAGEHILKAVFFGTYDIDYFRVEPYVTTSDSNNKDPVTVIQGKETNRLEAEAWTKGSQNVAFHESTYEEADVYKHPRAQRPGSNDPSQYVLQTLEGGSGGFYITQAVDSEWIRYKVYIQKDGYYKVAVKCITKEEGGGLTLSADDGSKVIIPCVAGSTVEGDFTWLEGEALLHLPSGEHILQLDIHCSCDIDCIDFTRDEEYAPPHPGDLPIEPVTEISSDEISRIEAEDWMNGGPGVAFADDDYTAPDTYQYFRAPRPDSEDQLVPQTRFLGDGNYIVTHIQDPDWMAYKINIEKTGTYRFAARCGSTWSPGNISFYLDNAETALTTIAVSTLPAFDWSLGMALGGIAALSAGEHVLKVVFFGIYDLDYIQIEPYVLNSDIDDGPVTVITGEGLERLEAEDWMGGGQSIAYQEVNYVTSYDEEHWRYAYDHPRAPLPDVNDPLVYVPQTFKLVDRFYINGEEMNLPEDEGEYVLAYTEEPEWINYRIDVKKAGTYQIDALAGTKYDSVIIALYEGDTLIAIINTINNGWDHYNLCKGDQYYLSEGEHTLTAKFFGGSDLNYFQFEWLSADPPKEKEDSGPIIVEEPEDYPELNGPITVDEMALQLTLDHSAKTATIYNEDITVYEALYGLYLEDGVTVRFFDVNGNEVTNPTTALMSGMRLIGYREGGEFITYTIVKPGEEPATEPDVDQPTAVDPDRADSGNREAETPAPEYHPYVVVLAGIIAGVSALALVLMFLSGGRKERKD